MLSRLQRTLPLSIALPAEVNGDSSLSSPTLLHLYSSSLCGLSEPTEFHLQNFPMQSAHEGVTEAQLCLPTLPFPTSTFPEGQGNFLGRVARTRY